MGLLGTVSAVGTALGPSLGGALIAGFGWSAVFAVMAGLGAVAFGMGLRMFPADAPGSGTSRRLDLAGMLVLVLALAAFALATSSGGSVAVSVLLAGLAMLGLIAFVAIEKRAQAPLIQLDLLRQGALSRGLGAMGLVSTIMMTTLVVGSFYLTGALHLVV